MFAFHRHMTTLHLFLFWGSCLSVWISFFFFLFFFFLFFFFFFFVWTFLILHLWMLIWWFSEIWFWYVDLRLDVSLTLCCFVVYSTRRFVLSLALCYMFLCFSVRLVLRLPRLGKRELILVLFVRLFDLRLFGLSVSSFSWCLGRTAVCDCGTPWIFLLPFFSPLHY